MATSANIGCETICSSEYAVTMVQKTFKRKARKESVVKDGQISASGQDNIKDS